MKSSAFTFNEMINFWKVWGRKRACTDTHFKRLILTTRWRTDHRETGIETGSLVKMCCNNVGKELC